MMEPPEEYGFDFDQVEENFDDFMDDEEAMVIFFYQFLCAIFFMFFFLFLYHSHTF